MNHRSLIFINVPVNVPVPNNFKTSLHPSPFPSPSLKFKTLSTVQQPNLQFMSSHSHSHQSLRQVSVKGDGRCLFRAIAKNLAKFDNRQLPEHLERADADFLRKLAWTSICKKRREEFVKKHIIEGNITSYCAVSNKPSFYAGEPELLALADELKIPISVYLKVDGGQIRNIATYGQQYSKSRSNNQSVRLLYVNGNHYDALLSRT